MKHIKNNSLAFAFMVVLVLASAAHCDQSETMADESSLETQEITLALVMGFAPEELSSTEVESLTLMRQEEKLARDVYLVLNEKWNQRVFGNIATSEQYHMAAIGMLLNKYNLTDPVSDDTVGVFADAHMQELFNELTGRGAESLLAALKVGAFIEELDISDLDEQLAQIDNQDITFVFTNLRRGSTNHLKAFVRNLAFNGVDPYIAQYLSPEEITMILATPFSTGQRAN